MLIKAVSGAITAANSSLSVTEINVPRSSSHLSQPEYLPGSQNLIKSSATTSPQKTPSPPPPLSHRAKMDEGFKF